MRMVIKDTEVQHKTPNKSVYMYQFPVCKPDSLT